MCNKEELYLKASGMQEEATNSKQVAEESSVSALKKNDLTDTMDEELDLSDDEDDILVEELEEDDL